MLSFADRLDARARAVDSLLCVGLDPHASDLPVATADAARAFCLGLIQATAPYAAAFKPNAAFFEALGAEGAKALKDVIDAVPEGIPVILDAKRGDIGSTSAAYATAAFDVLDADAITVSPYLGSDGVLPFLARSDRGAFILCRTSNEGGADIQDQTVRDDAGASRRVYELVADLANSWNKHNNVGLVVGATKPDELAAVRARCPSLWILAPGVGAQGGSLEDAVSAGVRADGLGLLVNVSRGISRAADPAAAAKDYVEQIRAARAGRQALAPVDRVADGLLRLGCVRFGTFTLKSGLTSPIYLDLRRLVGDSELLGEVAVAYGRVLKNIQYDVLAPLPYAALPIGTAVALHLRQPMVYPRREAKAYGTKASVEGLFEVGQTALVLDDLATTGDSKVEGIEKLQSVGLKVSDVVVLIDRESGATEAMSAVGVTMHAVYKISDLLARWEAQGAVSAEQAADVRAFLAATRPSPA